MNVIFFLLAFYPLAVAVVLLELLVLSWIDRRTQAEYAFLAWIPVFNWVVAFAIPAVCFAQVTERTYRWACKLTERRPS